MAIWDEAIDVLVVGAGGCGLVAAVVAHDLGARVHIFEKLPTVGGTTRLSAGSIPGAGTRFQRAAGIDDSPERYYRDLLRQSGPHDMEGLARVLTEESAALVEWLVDTVGLELRLITDFRHVGHSVNRLHAPASRTGAEVMDVLLQAVHDRDIRVHTGWSARELITGPHEAVLGVVFDRPDGLQQHCRAQKVVLASGGYAGNSDLVAQFAPEMASASYFGAPGATGEAVVWGQQLGARLGNIGAYNGYAVYCVPSRLPLSWTVVEKGGLAVNRSGGRFGNELVGYSGFAAEVLAQGGGVHIIFDARIRDTVATHEPKFSELVKMGAVRTFATLESLGEACAIDAAGLAETIDTYNACASDRTIDAWGRDDFGLAPLAGPWVACEVVAGLNATQGGLCVDERGRVLSSNGTPVANLFAGGGAAAGVSGQRGGRGYSSGNGLLGALGLGRIAGRSTALELRNEIGPRQLGAGNA